ncbi:ATP-binding protein [Thermococcus sp. Bubb.Bath]|uniref:AAA family ATPase n=1 Tax=Thermococcus sp. Bubb.Bath TaxID=1638242 RepID=UPI00143B22A7|nr:ATP-binding protein [Thermococcus sp. Bubb.Bath]NJF25734.1 ATP-binding protein [Thermococcus sp. Bubb.Bath]
MVENYFNVHPRMDTKELFGREAETKGLMDVLKASGWSAVLGPRMAGKTSLSIATAVKYAEEEKTVVIYINLSTARSFRDMTSRLVSAVSRMNEKGHINGAEFRLFVPTGIVGAGLDLKFKKPDKNRVSQRFEEVISILPEKSVVILDEVQEVQGRLDRMTRALWAVFNERPDVRFIFTGSYSGLVKKVVEAHYEEPMFGRAPIQIKVLPWPRRTAEDFLMVGLKKCGVNYSLTEVGSTVEILGTLPGWLNEYGFRRCLGETHEEALSLVRDSAITRARKELENLIKMRDPKAREVLRTISVAPRSWGELLRIGLSKPSLDSLLDTLTEGLFILKKEHIGYRTVYSFINPVYREAAKLL